jgi:hypothetical protein
MVPPIIPVASKPAINASSFAACLLNSSLFYWFSSVFSDCEHIHDALIQAFRIPNSWDDEDWTSIEGQFERSFWACLWKNPVDGRRDFRQPLLSFRLRAGDDNIEHPSMHGRNAADCGRADLKNVAYTRLNGHARGEFE